MINRIIKYSMVGLGIAVLILSLTVFFQYKKLQYNKLFSAVDTKVQLQMSRMGLTPVEKKIRKQGFFPPHPVAKIKTKIPLTSSLDSLLVELREEFESSKVQVLSLREENLENVYNIHMKLGQRGTLTHELLLSLKKAKIALLIDDFGYLNDNKLLDTFFKDLPIPFTASIIPGTQFAEEIAKIAHREKKQVIVHMPMQPEGNFNNQYKWIILNGMPPNQIKRKVEKAIESVPYAEGLNNHMGSLVTTKKELIEPVLEGLKDRGMFFVDSKTSSHSIAYSLARDLGLRATFNCVFLDNEKSEKYIENQFEKLVLQAFQRGWALGLGHSNMKTASALKRVVKTCDSRKIKFVTISEILR